MSWDAKSVEREITKAFITRRLDTGKVGPKGYGNNWPDILRDFSDLVGTEENVRRPRVRPTGKDIAAADEIFDIINSNEDMPVRKEIYLYHLCRSLRMPKEEIAKKLGVSRRVLGRRFYQYHQELAVMFCRSDCLRRRGKVDEAPKSPVIPRGIGELRQRENQGSIQSWMTEDARGSAEDFVETEAEE